MAEIMLTETILQARFGRRFEVEGDMSALSAFPGGNLLRGVFLDDLATGMSMTVRFTAPVGMTLVFDDGSAEAAIPAAGYIDHTYGAGDPNNHPWIHTVTLRDDNGRGRGWGQFEVPCPWSSPKDIAANPAMRAPTPAVVTAPPQPLPVRPSAQQPHRRSI